MRSAFQKLRSGLKKTRENVVGKIADVFSGKTKIDDELLEDLEEILVEADLGIDATMELLDDLREKSRDLDGADFKTLESVLREEIEKLLSSDSVADTAIQGHRPHVIMVVGVNGSGKTTTIGKLASQYKNEGKTVLIAAADTFRAAAMEQLEKWAHLAQVELVANKNAKDPASVAFDAAAAANARNVDVLIVDTAGRLHTQQNLMQELQKIHRVLGKQIKDAPHEVLLVLDATTGQNAIMQAKHFHQAVDIDGLVLTKLDGTAKGGVVIAINRELEMPVKYIGVGEEIDDLQPFDPVQFAEALFY